MLSWIFHVCDLNDVCFRDAQQGKGSDREDYQGDTSIESRDYLPKATKVLVGHHTNCNHSTRAELKTRFKQEPHRVGCIFYLFPEDSREEVVPTLLRNELADEFKGCEEDREDYDQNDGADQ